MTRYNTIYMCTRKLNTRPPKLALNTCERSPLITLVSTFLFFSRCLSRQRFFQIQEGSKIRVNIQHVYLTKRISCHLNIPDDALTTLPCVKHEAEVETDMLPLVKIRNDLLVWQPMLTVQVLHSIINHCWWFIKSRSPPGMVFKTL